MTDEKCPGCAAPIGHAHKFVVGTQGWHCACRLRDLEGTVDVLTKYIDEAKRAAWGDRVAGETLADFIARLRDERSADRCLQMADVLRVLDEALRALRATEERDHVLGIILRAASPKLDPVLAGLADTLQSATRRRAIAAIDNLLAAIGNERPCALPRALPSDAGARQMALGLDRRLKAEGFDRIGRIDATGRRSLWLGYERPPGGGPPTAILLRAGREGDDAQARVPAASPLYEQLDAVLSCARVAAEYEDPRGLALDVDVPEEPTP